MIKSKLNNIKDEALDCLKIMINPKSFWIYLPTVLAVASVYVAAYFNAQWYLAKGDEETLALIIMGSVILVLLVASAKFRNIGALFILLIAVNFFIREMDDTPVDLPYFGTVLIRTKVYIYIALGIMALWALWKEKKIISFLNEYYLVKTMLLGLITTYFVSQLIARRVFKHIPILPNEHHLHVPLEEITENFAHTFFLIMALTILWYSFHQKQTTEDVD